MHRRRRPTPGMLFVVLVAALQLAGVSVAQGQSPPPAIPSAVIRSTVPLTTDQAANVKENVDYYAGMLANAQSTPEQVEGARKQLVKYVETLSSPSDTFRFEYSRLLVPQLEAVVNGNNLHAAVNAFIVLGSLGTDKALDLALVRSDKLNEKRWQIRLHAVQASRALIGSNLLADRKIIDATKRLRDATAQEDTPEVLTYQLQALAEADNRNPNLPAESAQQVRDNFVTALEKTIRSIASAKEGPSETIPCIYNPLGDLRDEFLESIKADEQTKIGNKLAPTLVLFLDTARNHWESVKDDEKARQMYGDVLRVIEALLKRIDAVNRPGTPPPSTDLRASWNAGDMAKFESEVKMWSDVVSNPPYAPVAAVKAP